MARALLIVLDSVGIGGAPDAAAYGDKGADTLGHIAQACALGRGNREGLRAGPLRLPHLARLGLGHACRQATGAVPPGLEPQGEASALWGSAIETSRGKDTPSGHWELTGCPVDFDWGYFPQTVPTFAPDLIAALCREGGLPGILGNRHASGTAIIAELGAEHMRGGKPIVYTSTDSVLQIAAHEETFGLGRLLDLCVIARRLCDPLRIGRVIARPFVGTPDTGFSRTGNRRDFAVPPPRATLFDALAEAGREVVSVGKIADIFAHRATGHETKAHGNMAVVDACLAALDSLADGGFVFGNCVDFDSEFGHRRDVPGYAAALEAFDARVPDLLAALRPGDMLVLTADHGNDPTWPGTDHTREQVPVLAVGPGLSSGAIGTRSSLADVGASIAAHLGIDWRGPGTSFLAQGLR